MITVKEKELLIEIVANVDDVKNTLTDDQKKYLDKSFKRIYANYYNLLEGVDEH